MSYTGASAGQTLAFAGLTCSPGKHVLHASAIWYSSSQPVPTYYMNDASDGIYVSSVTSSRDDNLRLDVICAPVSGKTEKVIVD